MGKDERQHFTVTTARHVVASVAPEELPFFAATSEAFLRDPNRALAGRQRTDEALGSGIDAVVTLLSPAALAVAAAVYEQLTNRAGDAVVRGGGHMLSRLRTRFRRSGTTEGADTELVSVSPLTDEQRDQVRQVAESRARALGLPEDKVQLLVGAIMDSLDRSG